MKTLKFLSTGLSIGFVLTTFFLTLITGFNEVTLQIICWCVASALYGLSTMIFQIQSVKTVYLFICHYIFCLIITSINGFIFYREDLLLVSIIFTITYVVICVITQIIEKHNLKKLNEKLNKLNK